MMIYLISFFLLFFVFYLFFKSFFKSKKDNYLDLTSNQIDILEKNVLFYSNLSQEEKNRFSKRVADFLSRINIIEISCIASETDVILLGASAIIPVFGFNEWNYLNLKEVYLFPNAFNYNLEYSKSIKEKTILGMVGNGKLKDRMVISQKALRYGFQNKTDKNNTAIHEFVHLIDMADGNIDGFPESIIKNPFVLPWFDLMHKKIDKINENKSDINSYGATSKIEFFAVASEYFFERPKLLKRKHPILYKNLSQFFNQDLV
jgi:hypothetical protein